MTKDQSKSNKVQTGVTLDKEVLVAIDKERGLIKRSTYVNDMLRYALIEKDFEPNICENQVM